MNTEPDCAWAKVAPAKGKEHEQCLLVCERCGATHTVEFPVRPDQFGEICTGFAALHRECKSKETPDD